MCSDYRNRVELAAIDGEFSQLRIPLRFPEGRPNFEPRDDVRITNRAPIVRAAAAGDAEPGAAELVQRRWSWPGTHGKPVYNFRSDGRDFAKGRCLVIADGFYEFIAPDDPKAKRKHKWLFTMRGQPWFFIAGLWRSTPDLGPEAPEAFTLLTTEPGADIAPSHDRQIVVLPPSEASRWLDPSVPSAELTRPLPPGSLEAVRVA